MAGNTSPSGLTKDTNAFKIYHRSVPVYEFRRTFVQGVDVAYLCSRIPYFMYKHRRLTSSGLCLTAMVVLMSTLLVPRAAMTQDSLRCQGRLIEFGDSPEKVRKLCGAPTDVYPEERYSDAWISRYEYDPYGRPRLPSLTKGPIQYEKWTYDFGTNRLPYYLHFENGRLMRIESGNR